MKYNTLKRFNRKTKKGGKNGYQTKNKRIVRRTQKIRGGHIAKKFIKFLGKRFKKLTGKYSSHNNGMSIIGLVEKSKEYNTQQQIERNELHRLLTTKSKLPSGITIHDSVKYFYVPDERIDKTADENSYKYKWACAESLYDKLSHEDKSTLPLHENTRFYSFALSTDNLPRIKDEYDEYEKNRVLRIVIDQQNRLIKPANQEKDHDDDDDIPSGKYTIPDNMNLEDVDG